jgi:hypothetical protein
VEEDRPLDNRWAGESHGVLIGAASRAAITPSIKLVNLSAILVTCYDAPIHDFDIPVYLWRGRGAAIHGCSLGPTSSAC